MSKTEEWQADQEMIKLMVKADMPAIKDIANGEGNPTPEMIKKAKRYVKQFEEWPEGRYHDKPFAKRIHELWEEWMGIERRGNED